MSRTTGTASWRAHLGLPFVERELGTSPMRAVAISLSLTAAVGLMNLGYTAWLRAQADSPWAWLSERELLFLERAPASTLGLFDIQLVGALIVGAMFLAPTLAALMVTREAQDRTLDALRITPLSSLALHNGMTLGALARLAPWLLPPLAVHVLVGLAGGLEPATLLSTLALLGVGAWSMTSLGAMIGALLRDRVRGALGALMVLGLFGVLFGGPMLAPFDTHSEFMALLSPPGAIIHSLLTDAGPWLSTLEDGPMAIYPGALGLPISPTLMSLLLSLLLGAVSVHVGARAYGDPVAPPLDQRVALGTMGLLTLLGVLLVGQSLPEVGFYLDIQMQPADLIYFWGRKISAAAVVVVLIGAPAMLLLFAGALPSTAFVERARLWMATRPSDPARQEPPLSAGALYGLLGATLVVGAALLLSLAPLPPGMDRAMLWSSVSVGVLPFLMWGMLIILELLLLWRLSAQRLWHGMLVLGAVGFTGLLTLIYTVITIDTEHLTMASYSIGRDPLSMAFSMFSLVGFALAPLVLGLWLSHRMRAFGERLGAQLKALLTREERQEPFEWPQAVEPRQEALRCQLRPSLHHAPRSLESWLLGARGERAEVAERWLALEGSTLRAWSGSVHEGRAAAEIDLSRPFNLLASLQPEGDGARGPVLTLNLVVSQKRGDGPDEVARVGFAVPVRRQRALAELPLQDQRLERLGPADAWPILAALRYHAEASGVSLPF